MSRARTVIAEAVATTAAVSRKSQAMPIGSRTPLGDIDPVTPAATSAATAVTPIAGKEAISAASGKASRGHGVSFTREVLVTSEAVPMVREAWKNDQTVSPTSAKAT